MFSFDASNRRKEEERLRSEKRLPPGQSLTLKFPVLHYGPVPPFNPATWDLRVWGEVEKETRWNWDEFNCLPRTRVTIDLHCVTRWSKADTLWEGVAVRTLVEQGLIKLKPAAQFVMQHAEYGYTVNLPLAVVLQDNFFFHGTVRENISITKRNATLEEIIYAAKLAGAEEFIQEMPRGYDSLLEENASNLSGGQRQRLAIARALLTNPTILVFDEATSALDPESENVIQNNLAAMARGRTLIIVSHRLSIIHGADKILVLDKGEKTAFLPHNELVKIPGIYQEFWQQQMGRFL